MPLVEWNGDRDPICKMALLLSHVLTFAMEIQHHFDFASKVFDCVNRISRSFFESKDAEAVETM